MDDEYEVDLTEALDDDAGTEMGIEAPEEPQATDPEPVEAPVEPAPEERELDEIDLSGDREGELSETAEAAEADAAQLPAFLSTPFDEYSVSEGLLLLLVLLSFLSACVRIIKEGFSWL